MAYNYNSGYGQSNPYDNRGSFDTRSENPPPAYGGQGYGQGYAQHPDVEMQPLTGGAGAPYSQSATPIPQQNRDPNYILNQCRDIGRAIEDVQSRLPELQRLQKSFAQGTGASNKQIDAMSADIMTAYRGLADRVKRIKGSPGAGDMRNKAQVDVLDRRIRTAINSYQQTESQFRREVQEQQARQYRIVRPDATEQEVREATEDGGDTQIFQQALLNSGRQGQAQSALRNVQQRHDAMQQIERTMLELQQLFQDLDAIVVEQEPMVENIEQKTEETHQHVDAGNVHLDKGVSSARAARKKKWICLGICVAIIIIIIVIVLAYGATQGWFKSSGNSKGS